MKGLLVFLCVALATSSAIPPPPKVIEKSIIGDALALIKCVTNGVAEVEASIASILAAANQFEQLAATSGDKFDLCLAIGDGNPSLIQQIQIAQCLTETANTLATDAQNLVNAIVDEVNGLLTNAANLLACL